MGEEGLGDVAGSPRAVFIDTSIGSHLVVPVTMSDTVSELKRKIKVEHSLCFPDIGDLQILGLKVKRRGNFYYLSESMLVKNVFYGSKGNWFLRVDASRPKDRLALVSYRHDNLVACGDIRCSHPNGDRDEPLKEIVLIGNQRHLSTEDYPNESAHVERVDALPTCFDGKLNVGQVDEALINRNKCKNSEEKDASNMDFQHTSSSTTLSELDWQNYKKKKISGVCEAALDGAAEDIQDKRADTVVCTDIRTKELLIVDVVEQSVLLDVTGNGIKIKENVLAAENGDERTEGNRSNQQKMLQDGCLETECHEESACEDRKRKRGEQTEKSQTHSGQSEMLLNPANSGSWLDKVVADVLIGSQNWKTTAADDRICATSDSQCGRMNPKGDIFPEVADTHLDIAEGERVTTSSNVTAPNRSGGMSKTTHRKKKLKIDEINRSKILDSAECSVIPSNSNSQVKGSLNQENKFLLSETGDWTKDETKQKKIKRSRGNDVINAQNVALDFKGNDPTKDGGNDDETATASPIKRFNSHIEKSVVNRDYMIVESGDKEKMSQRNSVSEVPNLQIPVESSLSNGLKDEKFHEESKRRGKKKRERLEEIHAFEAETDRELVDVTFQEDLKGIGDPEPIHLVANDLKTSNDDVKHSVDDGLGAGDKRTIMGICQLGESNDEGDKVDIASKQVGVKATGDSKILKKGKQSKRKTIQVEPEKDISRHDVECFNNGLSVCGVDTLPVDDKLNTAETTLQEDLWRDSVVEELQLQCNNGVNNSNPDDQCLKEKARDSSKSEREKRKTKRKNKDCKTSENENNVLVSTHDLKDTILENPITCAGNNSTPCHVGPRRHSVVDRVEITKDFNISLPKKTKKKGDQLQLENDPSCQGVEYFDYNQSVKKDNDLLLDGRENDTKKKTDGVSSLVSDVLTQKERDSSSGMAGPQNDEQSPMKFKKKHKYNKMKSSGIHTEMGEDDYHCQNLSTDKVIRDKSKRSKLNSKEMTCTKGSPSNSNTIDNEYLGGDDGTNFKDYFVSGGYQGNDGSDQVSAITAKRDGGSKKAKETLHRDKGKTRQLRKLDTITHGETKLPGRHSREMMHSSKLEAKVDKKFAAISTAGGDSYVTTSNANSSWSSACSDGESNTDVSSMRRGSDTKGGVKQKSMLSSLSLSEILRSSNSFKKAKVNASRSIVEDLENQPLDFVPDSCPNL